MAQTHFRGRWFLADAQLQSQTVDFRSLLDVQDAQSQESLPDIVRNGATPRSEQSELHWSDDDNRGRKFDEFEYEEDPRDAPPPSGNAVD